MIVKPLDQVIKVGLVLVALVLYMKLPSTQCQQPVAGRNQVSARFSVMYEVLEPHLAVPQTLRQDEEDEKYSCLQS